MKNWATCEAIRHELVEKWMVNVSLASLHQAKAELECSLFVHSKTHSNIGSSHTLTKQAVLITIYLNLKMPLIHSKTSNNWLRLNLNEQKKKLRLIFLLSWIYLFHKSSSRCEWTALMALPGTIQRYFDLSSWNVKTLCKFPSICYNHHHIRDLLNVSEVANCLRAAIWLWHLIS